MNGPATRRTRRVRRTPKPLWRIGMRRVVGCVGLPAQSIPESSENQIGRVRSPAVYPSQSTTRRLRCHASTLRVGWRQVAPGPAGSRRVPWGRRSGRPGPAQIPNLSLFQQGLMKMSYWKCARVGAPRLPGQSTQTSVLFIEQSRQKIYFEIGFTATKSTPTLTKTLEVPRTRHLPCLSNGLRKNRVTSA